MAASSSRRQPGTGPNSLLTIPQVAAELGVSKMTVYRRIADGLIKRHDIGVQATSKTRVKRMDLDAYIDGCYRAVPSRTRRAA